MRVVVTDAPPSLGKEWSRRENRDAKKNVPGRANPVAAARA
jgi:hypothetical protein